MGRDGGECGEARASGLVPFVGVDIQPWDSDAVLVEGFLVGNAARVDKRRNTR